MRRSLRVICAALLLAIQSAWSQPAEEIFHPDPRFGDGFADIDLRIRERDCPHWDLCQVTAGGTYKGTAVAIRVDLKRSAKGNLLIEYRSLGTESDQLLQSLARLYKVDYRDARFKQRVVGDFVPLIASDSSMKGKVFFAANGPEADYAELYTNIDLARGMLEIHEKDEGYRKNVIRALSATPNYSLQRTAYRGR